MDKNDHIRYWVETSQHDLNAAQSVFESGKYDWSLFIAHLALEKLLKAMWIKNNENFYPPKVHNLAKIAEESKLNLTESDRLFLLEVNEFNLEARYPDYKFGFYKRCTREFAKEYLERIKEFYECILKMI